MATVRATLSGTPEETSKVLRRAAADLGYTLAEKQSELPTHIVFKKGVTAFSWGIGAEGHAHGLECIVHRHNGHDG